MEDNAHMSEKLLLSEQAQESLRVNFFSNYKFFISKVWPQIKTDKVWPQIKTESVAADKN